ncbi:MAG: flagellin [Planctomycetota bacterium]|jgi:flagellin
MIGFYSSFRAMGASNNRLSQLGERLLASQARLSRGSRLAKLGTDSSGLSISTKMKGLIDSFQVASRNVSDGISLAETAEGGLEQVADNLIRMRELAVRASNGTLSSSDRTSIHNEFNELREEVDRISDSTEFNGVDLLDGSTSSVSLQSGAYSGNTTDVDLVDTSSAALSIDDLDLTTSSDASSAISAIDDAIDEVSVARASFGSSVNTLRSGLSTLQSSRISLSETHSRISDLDYAAETAELTKLSLLHSAAVSTRLHASLSSNRVNTLLIGHI